MNPSDLESDYRDVKKPIYEVLVSRLRELLPIILQHSSISTAQIEGRAKDVRSFVEKIERKGYSQPYHQMKDLAGLRIITYYHDDVDRVTALIRQEFQVDDNHSTDKLDELEVDAFGYRSFHLVCSLKDDRVLLPEWQDYRDIWFEIQVRSVLQHAWAAISHKLDYKTASEVPKEFRRKLFRLSALLEVADSEFAQIRDKSASVQDDYRKEVDAGFTDVPLNLDSLREFVKEKVDVENWIAIGLAAGMQKSSITYVNESSLRRLHSVLEAIGAVDISESANLLEKYVHSPPKALTLLAERCSVWAPPIDVASFAVALGEHDRLPLGFSFPALRSDIQNGFNEVIKQLESTGKK